MHKQLLALTTLLLTPLAASGQDWTNTGGFPDNATWTEAIHGIAVDGAGKVWVQAWAPRWWIDPATGDSVRDAAGNAVRTRLLFVYNPDGSEAMEPVRTITVGGVQDTLIGNLRGLRRDHNGDILVATGSGVLYRINHMTGEGMAKAEVAGGSLSAPGVDAMGNIFVANVVPGAPIQIYNSDLERQGNAVDSSQGFSRSFDVSADGNSIYWAGYSNFAVYRYSRSDEFSPFDATPDTLLAGIVSEAIVRHPTTGHIWFSNAPAAGADPAGPFASPDRIISWLAYDPDSDALVDSFNYQVDAPVGNEKARAISFSPDGMTAYVGIWDTNGNTSVKKITRGPTGLQPDENTVPNAFSLGQNYPNPFNPQTTIAFALTEAGAARLVVHNVLGQQVAILVDGHLAAGTYSARFDGRDLASGTYFYHLEFGGKRLTGKMLLLK